MSIFKKSIKVLTTFIFLLFFVFGFSFLNFRMAKATSACIDDDNDGICISIISPSKGEILRVGDIYQIKWIQENIDSVSISVGRGSMENSIIFKNVDSQQKEQNYDWSIPGYVIGDDQKLCVHALKSGIASDDICSEEISIISKSDTRTPDEIKANIDLIRRIQEIIETKKEQKLIEIISPKENILIAGETYEFKWTQENIYWVQIEYKTSSSSGNWIEFSKNVDPYFKEQSIKWKVPNSLIGQKNIYIVISTLSPGDPNHTISKGPFSVISSNTIENNSSPVISNIKAVYSPEGSLMYVKWETDRESDSWVRFKTAITRNQITAYSEESEEGSYSLTKNHLVKFNIPFEAKVSYRVISGDALGYKSMSDWQLLFSPYSNIVNKEQLNSFLNITNNINQVPTMNSVVVKNQIMYSRLKGKIMLKVQAKGEAYYIHPDKLTMYYLGRPNDAFKVMREQGIGITNTDLAKIPVESTNTKGDQQLVNRLKGKILLQVQQHGEAWYVNPADGKRYFLGRPQDAFNVMRNLGVGISNSDFDKLE